MKTAIIFPGQGSQSVGMMADFYQKYDFVQKTYQQASEALGYDLWQLSSEGPAEKLNQTEYTQPAMLVAGYAAWQVWLDQSGIKPHCVAGHSLGEYTALLAAGVLSLPDAVTLVASRGRLMQQAVPEGKGAMAAVLGLEDQQVIDVCASVEGVVEAVNFNSPGQVVIAGEKASVEQAMQKMAEKGAKKTILLPVSVPSHSSLMKEAAEELAEILDKTEMKQPEFTVFQNVSAAAGEEVAQIKQALKAQLYRPVLWVKTFENIMATGVENVIEIGPGKVLTGLAKRINRRFPSFNVEDTASLQKTLEKVKK